MLEKTASNPLQQFADAPAFALPPDYYLGLDVLEGIQRAVETLRAAKIAKRRGHPTGKGKIISNAKLFEQMAALMAVGMTRTAAARKVLGTGATKAEADHLARVFRKSVFNSGN
jgi:hypothetical protein